VLLSALVTEASPLNPALKKRASPVAKAMAVNCRTHNEDARNPAATAKKIVSASARTVLQN
jgi:hypothetical protein